MARQKTSNPATTRVLVRSSSAEPVQTIDIDPALLPFTAILLIASYLPRETRDLMRMDFIKFLPSELSLHILSFLDPKSRLNASVNERWMEYVEDATFWKTRMQEESGEGLAHLCWAQEPAWTAKQAYLKLQSFIRLPAGIRKKQIIAALNLGRVQKLNKDKKFSQVEVQKFKKEQSKIAAELLNGFTSLCLRNNQVNIGVFSEILKTNRTLCDLTIIGNCFADTDENIAALAAGFAGNETLQEISLDMPLEGDSKIAALGNALRHNSRLRRLAIHQLGISHQGLHAFVVAFKDHTAIRSLNFSDNYFGPVGGTLLAEFLCDHPLLTCLNFGGTRLGDQGLSPILDIMPKLKKLCELDLHGNEVSNEGAEKIAKMIEANSSLTSVNVCENYIGDVGAMPIFAALKINCVLTELFLHCHRSLTNGCCEFLKEVIQNYNFVIKWLGFREGVTISWDHESQQTKFLWSGEIEKLLERNRELASQYKEIRQNKEFTDIFNRDLVFFVIQKGDQRLLERLLRCIPDLISHTTKNGTTLIDFAKLKDRKEIASYLAAVDGNDNEFSNTNRHRA